MTVKELLDFFNYLERRGFLRDDLQCDPEHQVETYLNDFCNGDKPTETQYVDLGLPSGTLWATCNVGADSPEECGDYFAWGETKPKSYYGWSTYKYCNNKDYDYDKYGYTDNKTELDSKDDAATVNWGSDWRMPTKEEFDELKNECRWEWTAMNGKGGFCVTGPNGNNLFLPAAGEYNEDVLYDAGDYGIYWSNTLNTNFPSLAYYLYFNSAKVDWDDYARCHGRSVRPVFKNR